MTDFDNYVEGEGFDEVPEPVKELLGRTANDTQRFGEIWFKDSFYAPSEPKLHGKIYKLVDSKAQKIVIASGRGIGKTTIARLVANKGILYNDVKFICYVSKSEGHAMMQTENIKNELISNPLIQKVFGNVKVADYASGLSEEFSKKSWVAFGRTLVVPRGSGQQVRGLNWRGFRPDLIIIDDLEDTQNLNNEFIRNDRWQWFDSDVVEAIPQIDDEEYARQKWRILYIDTIKHADALILKLLEDPEWASTSLSVCDKNYKTIVPVYYSQEKLDKKLEHHRNNRTMDIFAMEFMAQPVSREAASFKPEYFKYYSATDDWYKKQEKDLHSVVLIDPAKTANMANAQSGIVNWKINLKTGAMLFHEGRGEYHHPDQLYADSIDTCVRGGGNIIAVETTGLNEFVTHPFRTAIAKSGHKIHLEELSARTGKGEFKGEEGGKIGRIAALVHYYRKGMIWHNKDYCGPYEQQLLSFPRSKLWDIMDAAAYIVFMLENNMIYFYDELEQDEKVLEEEYEGLMEPDSEFEYSDLWRTI